MARERVHKYSDEAQENETVEVVEAPLSKESLLEDLHEGLPVGPLNVALMAFEEARDSGVDIALSSAVRAFQELVPSATEAEKIQLQAVLLDIASTETPEGPELFGEALSRVREKRANLSDAATRWDKAADVIAVLKAENEDDEPQPLASELAPDGTLPELAELVSKPEVTLLDPEEKKEAEVKVPPKKGTWEEASVILRAQEEARGKKLPRPLEDVNPGPEDRARARLQLRKLAKKSSKLPDLQGDTPPPSHEDNFDDIQDESDEPKNAEVLIIKDDKQLPLEKLKENVVDLTSSGEEDIVFEDSPDITLEDKKGSPEKNLDGSIVGLAELQGEGLKFDTLTPQEYSERYASQGKSDKGLVTSKSPKRERKSKSRDAAAISGIISELPESRKTPSVPQGRQRKNLESDVKAEDKPPFTIEEIESRAKGSDLEKGDIEFLKFASEAVAFGALRDNEKVRYKNLAAKLFPERDKFSETLEWRRNDLRARAERAGVQITEQDLKDDEELSRAVASGSPVSSESLERNNNLEERIAQALKGQDTQAEPIPSKQKTSREMMTEGAVSRGFEPVEEEISFVEKIEKQIALGNIVKPEDARRFKELHSKYSPETTTKSLSPEEEREATIERIKTNTAEVNAQTEQEAKELGILDKLKSLGNWYRKELTWKKRFVAGAICVGLGLTGATVGGTLGAAISSIGVVGNTIRGGLSAIGTFTLVEGGLQSHYEKTGLDANSTWAKRRRYGLAGALAFMNASGMTGQAIGTVASPIFSSIKNWLLDNSESAQDLFGAGTAVGARPDVISRMNDADVERVAKAAADKVKGVAAGLDKSPNALDGLDPYGKLKSAAGEGYKTAEDYGRVGKTIVTEEAKRLREFAEANAAKSAKKLARKAGKAASSGVFNLGKELSRTEDSLDKLLREVGDGKASRISGIAEVGDDPEKLLKKSNQLVREARKALDAGDRETARGLADKANEFFRRAEEIKVPVSEEELGAKVTQGVQGGIDSGSPVSMSREDLSKLKDIVRTAEPEEARRYVVHELEKLQAVDLKKLTRSELELVKTKLALFKELVRQDDLDDATVDEIIEKSARSASSGLREALRSQVYEAASQSETPDTSEVEAFREGVPYEVALESKNEKINSMFSRFGGAIQGVNSRAWSGIRELDTRSLLNRPISRFRILFDPIDQAQRLVRSVVAETGVQPKAEESVDAFLTRAYGGR